MENTKLCYRIDVILKLLHMLYRQDATVHYGPSWKS